MKAASYLPDQYSGKIRITSWDSCWLQRGWINSSGSIIFSSIEDAEQYLKSVEVDDCIYARIDPYWPEEENRDALREQKCRDEANKLFWSLKLKR